MRTRTDIQLYTWAKNTLEKAGLAKANPEVEISACDENTVLWRA